MYRTDQSIGEVAIRFVSYNISSPWPLSLNDFNSLFCCVTVECRLYSRALPQFFVPLTAIPCVSKKNVFFCPLDLPRSFASGPLTAEAEMAPHSLYNNRVKFLKDIYCIVLYTNMAAVTSDANLTQPTTLQRERWNAICLTLLSSLLRYAVLKNIK